MSALIEKLRPLWHHELTKFIIIGILIRFALIPYFGWPDDLNAYCNSLIYFTNGFSPYAVHASCYPPFIYFILYPIFTLAHLVGLNPGYQFVPEAANTGALTGMVGANIVNPTFLILWKIPSLCFDVLTGLLIYRFAKELSDNPKLPKLAFLIWFFNPFTLSITYLHGAYDVIAAFFILLGVYLVYKEHYLFAGLGFGLGILVKLYPAYIALPIIFLLLFRGVLTRRRTFEFKSNAINCGWFVLGIAIPLLLFAPLLIDYFHLMFYSVAPEIEMGGGMRGLSRMATIFYPVAALALSLILCRFLKWTPERSASNMLFAIILFAGLIFPIIGGVVPQYLLGILPLLVVLAMRRRWFFLPYALISVGGLVFLLSLQSPYAFLFPLATYTNVCTPGMISDHILSYMAHPELRGNLISGARLIITLSSLGAVFLGVRHLWRGG